MLADKRISVAVFLTLLVVFLLLPVGQKTLQILLKPFTFAVTTNSATRDEVGSLLSENESLRQRIKNFGAEESYESSGIVTEIIGRTPNPYEQILIANSGARDGVVEGAHVVARGSLIGIVYKVDETRSFIQLLSDQNFKAIGVSQDGVEGIVTGKFNQLVFERVPQNSGLKVDDVVFASSVDPRLPSNIVIGRVAEINIDKTGLLIEALLETDVDYLNVGVVTISGGLGG